MWLHLGENRSPRELGHSRPFLLRTPARLAARHPVSLLPALGPARPAGAVRCPSASQPQGQVPLSFPALAPLCRPPAPRRAGAGLAERGGRLYWQRVSVWEGDRQTDGQTWTVWAVVFLGSINPGRSPAGHRLQHSACPDRGLHRGRDTGCQRTREDLEGEWGGVRGLPGAVGDGGDERNVPWAQSEGNKGRSEGHRASLQGTWPLPI